jgi:hypothetical protein
MSIIERILGLKIIRRVLKMNMVKALEEIAASLKSIAGVLAHPEMYRLRRNKYNAVRAYKAAVARDQAGMSNASVPELTGARATLDEADRQIDFYERVTGLKVPIAVSPPESHE